MKRLKKLRNTGILFLITLLPMLSNIACKKVEQVQKATPPVIYLINPLTDGVRVVVSVNDTLQIIAVTQDEDGTVIKVQFFIDGELLGQRLEEPWIQGVIFMDPGNYEISVLAYDNQLLTSDTIKVDVEVIDPFPFKFNFLFEGETSYIYENEMTYIYAGAWSSSSRVTAFSLWIDSTFVGSANASYVIFETDTLSRGIHTLYGIATDEFGVTKRSADVFLNVYPQPSNRSFIFSVPESSKLQDIAVYPFQDIHNSE